MNYFTLFSSSSFSTISDFHMFSVFFIMVFILYLNLAWFVYSIQFVWTNKPQIKTTNTTSSDKANQIEHLCKNVLDKSRFLSSPSFRSHYVVHISVCMFANVFIIWILLFQYSKPWCRGFWIVHVQYLYRFTLIVSF